MGLLNRGISVRKSNFVQVFFCKNLRFCVSRDPFQKCIVLNPQDTVWSAKQIILEKINLVSLHSQFKTVVLYHGHRKHFHCIH